MVIKKYLDLLRLFPHFKKPCIIAVANLDKSQEHDPEDLYVANTILKCLVDIQGSDEKVKIKYVPSISAIESDKNLIALGGWTAPNKDISYLPSFSNDMPHRELYFNIDPQMAKKEVSRKFLGQQKKTVLRAVWDRKLGINGKLPAETHDGWLTKDYLLISSFPLKCLTSAEESLFVTSFEGLYGSATMAVELFFRDFDKKLKESIFTAIGNSLCFQILCSAYNIGHSGDFSYAKEIDFVKAYPIADPWKLKRERDTITSMPQRVKQDVGGKTFKERKAPPEYELSFSGQKKELISSVEAEEIRKRKGYKPKDEIFIDDERKEVFFNKKLIDEFQGLNYSLLRHFVENEGIGGNKMNIYESVWEDNPDAVDDIKINSTVDANLSRFRDLLQKCGIGNISIRKDGIRRVYILGPKRAYCILRKVENEEI